MATDVVFAMVLTIPDGNMHVFTSRHVVIEWLYDDFGHTNYKEWLWSLKTIVYASWSRRYVNSSRRTVISF